MRRAFMGLTLAALFTAMSLAQPSAAEPKSDQPKHGGVLRIYHRDSPASASILEEATVSTNAPFMGVFNNLVLFDQHVAQNSFDSIRPELATSWVWSNDKAKLTFKLRPGVKWHDGVPFTAKDVKCTFDMLMDRSSAKLRKNPRQSWYANVRDVTINGDDEVSFQLGRPQPSLIALLASGYAPIYPCHVSPRDMRTHPIGTGPFKFVEFKQNESIKLTRNPDYWRTRPAVSRRRRVHHHPEPLDRDPGVHRRQVRHDLPDRGDDPAAQGRQGAGPAGGVCGGAHQRQHQPDRQSRLATLRQRRAAPRDGAGAGP